jgi:hypothetical protein
VAFPRRQIPASATQLQPAQRRALEAIRDHGAWQVNGSIFANYTLLLRGFGLPSDPDSLARWLAF